MATPPLTAREFIQKSFSPCISVMSSPLVDEICQKNNLSFIELLEPFTTLDKEVSFKDPTGSIIMVRNQRIVLSDVNQKPAEPAIARKLLNESVTCDFDKIEMMTLKSGSISVEVPTAVPWFEKWRDTFFKVQFPSDHEFTKHYIACMLVITSKDDNPLESLSNMIHKLHHLFSLAPPKTMPKWFSSSVLRYYVLLHDVSMGDEQKAEKVFEEMKLTYNASCCHLLRINSSVEKVTDVTLQNYWKNIREEENSDEEVFTGDGAATRTKETSEFLITSDVLLHPLSPELESQRMFNSSSKEEHSNYANDVDLVTRGTHLTDNDISNIKNLVSCFIVSSLIPFVETQMQYLNEVVLNKKKSFFSATKRWLGSKPSSTVTVPNAHYYHPDSPELQMRRLADLCFMFGAYNAAFNAYHSIRSDFRNDGAWLHFAGALEMLALSAFLIGQDIKKAQEYTDESVLSYLNVCRMPQFATRLTLCSTECLKNLNLYGEAAGRLLLMTCEDSDLRSALLLEEASYCFVKSRKLFMPRKYAFHLVLAGHRFSKAGQKRHSLRCYRQAFQVYQDKNWCLAEDHIHFTIGKLASALNQKETTITEFAKLFEKPSAQSPAQQANFLKEYFVSLTEHQKTNNVSLTFLQIPRIDHSTIKVSLNTCEKIGDKEGYVLANKMISEDELTNRRWCKLEEQIIACLNNGILPLLFKPTTNTFSNRTKNSTKPVCVVGEKIRMSVDLVNILNIPFTLKNIKLLWIHSLESNDAEINKDTLVETEELDSLSLDPDSRHNISLHLTPIVAGELHITGIVYSVHLAPTTERAEGVSITGYVTLKPQGMKIISSKDKKETSDYAPDYRLQLVAVEDSPRLKVYFKNLPTEMLCGEVKETTILLENVGKLPVYKVFFVSSENSMFALPTCKSENDVFALPCGIIEPGGSQKITIFIRAGDTSGRISIDLLFYYDSEKSSQQRNAKYRLIYHTMHVLIHESLLCSVTATRSLVVPSKGDTESVNFRVLVENKNQEYDSHKTTIRLEKISLLSSTWKLKNIISSRENGANKIDLDREQTAFIVLRANRETNKLRSDLFLCTPFETTDANSNPFDNFVSNVVEKLSKNELEVLSKSDDLTISRAAITINSMLILYWKAVVITNGESVSVRGQHHVPVFNLGQKYVSNVDIRSQIELTPSISSLSLYYNRTFAMHELVSVKMKHAPNISHSFSSSRICCIPIELFVHNCCDDSIEIKLDGTYRAHNNLSKINESSMFLWLGLVLHTFFISSHSCLQVPLTLCIGSTGTYDLGTQINVSARKKNSNDVFVPQSSVPHSLLSITNSIL